MSMLVRNFVPIVSTTAAPTAVSAVVNFPTVSQVAGAHPVSVLLGSVLLQNLGAQTVFFKLVSAAGGTADGNSTALQPGCAMVFDIGQGLFFAPPFDGSNQPVTGAAFVTTSGTGSVNISMGLGS